MILPSNQPVPGRVLVVGAGISGIRSALDLAGTGHEVTLIDKAPHMGGILSKLDHQFPNDGCGMCRMLPLTGRDCASQFCLRKGLFHDRIAVLLQSRLAALEGEPGNYTALIRKKKGWIDPDLCMGCGECADACPIEIPYPFNQDMGTVKAVYLPLPHMVPNHYIIDETACTRCGSCTKVCTTNAITLPEDEKKAFRMLVVDDELIVRDSLKEWFEYEQGFSVDMASSGQEALDMLDANQYSLMLLDIKMPGMDGTQVLKLAAERHPGLYVIMMTAYATVESAVETLKHGALDYVIKPFDPDSLIPKVQSLFQEKRPGDETDIPLAVNAVILACGTDFADPGNEKDIFGYNSLPDVVTSLEFERIISGTGPFQGKLERPSDGKPLERIAWIQCVESRTLQTDAGYCSSVCCMMALKEAVLVKKRSQGRIDTVIYYMDMRCFGKDFESYRTMAETVYGVRLIPARPHSIWSDADTGRLCIQAATLSGTRDDETVDLVVLSVGQRPSPSARELSKVTGLALNAFGFPETGLLEAGTPPGVFAAGSFSGLKDISETLIFSSSAAARAASLIYGSPKVPGPEDKTPMPPPAPRDVSKEIPATALVICQCPSTRDQNTERIAAIRKAAENDPHVKDIKVMTAVCTQGGWASLTEYLAGKSVNRALIQACLPHRFTGRLKTLAQAMKLDPCYLTFQEISQETPESAQAMTRIGIASLRHADPPATHPVQVTQSVLVAGGGIAGMTAALSIADNGCKAVLVEKSSRLGGNLNWLARGINGENYHELLADVRQKIEKHSRIETLLETSISSSEGGPGHFVSVLESKDNQVTVMEHGAVVIATGGREADTDAYSHRESRFVLTTSELEIKLTQKELDPMSIKTLVMIQCVGSREEGRPYCSRVCCRSSLKQALLLKTLNPDMTLFILYRDMMSYGFSEIHYTRAREAGILFIRYTLETKPVVVPREDGVLVSVFEPIIGGTLEIDADQLVLATGIVPETGDNLIEVFGARKDSYTFFQAADPKFRPVDAMKDGVFACGLTLGPRDVEETMASAQAAAMGALKIVRQKSLDASTLTALVKPGLCSLCLQCIDACPYGAREVNPELRSIVIDNARCQGCGACAAVCPNSASYINCASDRQFLEIIDAAVDGPWLWTLDRR